MKIASPKLFYFSLVALGMSVLIGSEVHEALGAAATRDFNFAEPLSYGLILIQAVIALTGVIVSLEPTK